MCYELNGSTSTLNLSSKNASVGGYFMELMATGEVNFKQQSDLNKLNFPQQFQSR